MAQKPSIPKGTRDFLPVEVERRNYLFDTIKKVFKKYGFGPIETPSFELSSTLMGKYGEEGDRLIFRILNSGDKMLKADTEALENKNLPRFANSLAEKALRYDLTVPFARFVVQHQNEITFPFKRYQIHLWCNTKMKLPSRSNAIKFNLFGVLIVHNMGVTKNSPNAMPM